MKTVTALMSCLALAALLSAAPTCQLSAQYSFRNGSDALSMTCKLDNPYIVKDRREVYLNVNLLGKKSETVKERPSLNIALVVDRSGSMSGAKIEAARKACRFIVDNLGENDYVSLIVYDNEVSVLAPSGKTNRESLKRLIDGITDRGSTNLGGGLLEGYQQVQSTFDREYVNRVFLLTDGLANAGITSPDSLRWIAHDRNMSQNITVSTFGLGADYNERLLTTLAEEGGGNYYFIDTPDKISAIFAKELKGLVSVVAQNTRLNITFPDRYLRLASVIGAPYKLTGNTVEFSLKDVIAEEQKNILVKFEIAGPLQEDAIFGSALSFADASTNAPGTAQAYDTLKLTTDKALFDKSFNPDISGVIVMQETNAMLETAMVQVDSRDFKKAKETVTLARKRVESQLKQSPGSQELARQKGLILDYDKRVADAEKMSDDDLKVMQKASRESNYQIRNAK